MAWTLNEMGSNYSVQSKGMTWHDSSLFLKISILFIYLMEFPQSSVAKELTCNAGDLGSICLSLGQKDLLEKEMASYSSILAWRIPWTEEPDSPHFFFFLIFLKKFYFIFKFYKIVLVLPNIKMNLPQVEF